VDAGVERVPGGQGSRGGGLGNDPCGARPELRPWSCDSAVRPRVREVPRVAFEFSRLRISHGARHPGRSGGRSGATPRW
jgi:hypothetical protein